eukprot:93763_1
MSNTTAPKTIEDLKKQMKALGVSEENNIKFQDEIDDADHDIESIKEDISDREQSMLVDFFRDELKDEKIYDIVKSIMDGTSYTAAPDTINKPPQESKKDDKKLKKKDENNNTIDIQYDNTQLPTQNNSNSGYGMQDGIYGGYGDSLSIFDCMFGGGSHSTNTAAKKSPEIRTILDITLEDVYAGGSKTIKIQRRVACKKDNASVTCSKCNGQGSTTHLERMGPMVLQKRSECSMCNGIGYILDIEEYEIKCDIPIGCLHTEKITIIGEGHRYPNMIKGDVIVVIKVNKHSNTTELIRYQYGQLAFTICGYLSTAIGAPVLRVTFEGLIWTVLPMLTVVANDVFAYGFGKIFGKHQLTLLSPKKTWEGYIYSAIATIPFGYLMANFFMRYNVLFCPKYEFSFGLVDCEPNIMFFKTEYNIYGYLINIEPFQIYNFVISIWIAIICPIGGFMASGYKRAFGLKNYGSIIPGHGGITDRMDAEVLMCGFVPLFYNIIMMKQRTLNVDELQLEITSSLTNQDVSMVIKLLESLITY